MPTFRSLFRSMRLHHLTLIACFAFRSSIALAAPQAAGARAIPEGVTPHLDLAYVAGGSEKQKLDLYLPSSGSETGAVPLIIWVHGGGWAAGDKAGCPPLHAGFTQRGFAVASIGYRLTGEAIFPAQIEDCKAAIRWLRQHAAEYRLDPKRFGVWGSSAGGHLVALIGTSGGVKRFDTGENLDQSSAVQAVCDFYGPTDLLQMDAHAIPEATMKHDAPNSPESRLLGGTLQESKEKAAVANPLTYLAPGVPPFLIVHGDKDPLVPLHQSQLLFEAIRQVGGDVEMHTVHGGGHGKGFGGDVNALTARFFEETLRDGKPKKGANTSESTAEPIRANAGGAPPLQQLIANQDTDKDGRVSRGEFKGPPPMFDRLDRNRDGFLSTAD